MSQKTLINALSESEKIDPGIIAHRLMGKWNPDNTTIQELLGGENINDEISKPYPFFLAYPVEAGSEELGNPEEWQAEWKWDGIRGRKCSGTGMVDILLDKR